MDPLLTGKVQISSEKQNFVTGGCKTKNNGVASTVYMIGCFRVQTNHYDISFGISFISISSTYSCHVIT
jgi:hypothetical protein